MRKSLLLATGVGVLIGVVVAVLLLLPERKSATSERAETATAPPTDTKASPTVAVTPPPALPKPAAAPSPALTNRSVSVQSTNSAERQMVAELWEISSSRDPITKEQAEKFKKNLEELVRRGAAAVPALREFLDKNLDSYFNELSGGDQLSYVSLRAALFDALKQIGGTEAQAAMLATLQTTALPVELLELAKDLEMQAPGQYREQILKAAHEALEMAQANQLGSNVELGPAFRMLDTYGAQHELAQTDPSIFYNAVAMANQPDGKGLASLIQMAQSAGPGATGQAIATEMIAQLAAQNPLAMETLIQMVQREQISTRIWARLAPILAGDEYQITKGGPVGAEGGPTSSEGETGRNYAVVNTVTTPDQIGQRIALINRFLGQIPPDSAAAAALLHQRDLLAARLSN